jgi:hypothetical protein
MSTKIEPGEGLVMRQTLPSDYHQFKRDEARRMWRWVLWAEERVTTDEALALRRVCSDEHWCLVYVERGPKGGWTGATFTQLCHRMPPLKKLHTWYLGWVFLDHVPSHRNVPTAAQIDEAAAKFERQRTTIVLHA